MNVHSEVIDFKGKKIRVSIHWRERCKIDWAKAEHVPEIEIKEIDLYEMDE